MTLGSLSLLDFTFSGGGGGKMNFPDARQMKIEMLPTNIWALNFFIPVGKLSHQKWARYYGSEEIDFVNISLNCNELFMKILPEWWKKLCIWESRKHWASQHWVWPPVAHTTACCWPASVFISGWLFIFCFNSTSLFCVGVFFPAILWPLEILYM